MDEVDRPLCQGEDRRRLVRIDVVDDPVHKRAFHFLIEDITLRGSVVDLLVLPRIDDRDSAVGVGRCHLARLGVVGPGRIDGECPPLPLFKQERAQADRYVDHRSQDVLPRGIALLGLNYDRPPLCLGDGGHHQGSPLEVGAIRGQVELDRVVVELLNVVEELGVEAAAPVAAEDVDVLSDQLVGKYDIISGKFVSVTPHKPLLEFNGGLVEGVSVRINLIA